MVERFGQFTILHPFLAMFLWYVFVGLQKEGAQDKIHGFFGSLQGVNALDFTISVAAKSAIEEPLQGISININYWYFSWILLFFSLLHFQHTAPWIQVGTGCCLTMVNGRGK